LALGGSDQQTVGDAGPRSGMGTAA
jgi:hypothetical protein